MGNPVRITLTNNGLLVCLPHKLVFRILTNCSTKIEATSVIINLTHAFSQVVISQVKLNFAEG